jgi:hypothetical protein
LGWATVRAKELFHPLGADAFGLTVIAFVTIATLVFACSIARAAEGSKPSDREVAKIKSVLSEIGCEGGEYVKELSGLFEIDNAKCKIGEFDLKLDKDFDVALVSGAKSSEVRAHRTHAGRPSRSHGRKA